jgi:hypothetical protein
LINIAVSSNSVYHRLSVLSLFALEGTSGPGRSVDLSEGAVTGEGDPGGPWGASRVMNSTDHRKVCEVNSFAGITNVCDTPELLAALRKSQ